MRVRRGRCVAKAARFGRDEAAGLDFDARSREYIRYSLANKLPECLASGAAVLAVGPDDVGTIARVADLHVGELVTVADAGLLSDATSVKVVNVNGILTASAARPI